MANPDDVIPDLPALPPGSEFSYLEGRLHEIFAPMNEADIPRGSPFRGTPFLPGWSDAVRGREA